MQIADSCRLTVTHSGLREGANAELYGRWPVMLRYSDAGGE